MCIIQALPCGQSRGEMLRTVAVSSELETLCPDRPLLLPRDSPINVNCALLTTRTARLLPR